MRKCPFCIEVSVRSSIALKNKVKYVFDTFMKTLGVPWYMEREEHTIDHNQKIIKLLYAEDMDHSNHYDIFIRSSKSGELFFKQKDVYDVSKISYWFWKGKKIPIFFEDCNGVIGERDVRVPSSGGQIRLDVDIITSAFFWLSLWQEMTCPERDQFGRFPYSQSIQARAGIPPLPYVNNYLDIFLEVINSALRRQVGYSINFNPWPHGKKFAVCLSHDIDWVKKDLEVIDQGTKAKKKITCDYWNFEHIVRHERKRNFRSSFYFLAGGKEPLDWCGHRYDIKQKQFISLFRELQDQGCEVGLHGSFKTYTDLKALQLEKSRLESVMDNPVVGGRQHFLRFNQSKTFKVLEKAGMLYDNTLGYAEIEGFRNGFAFPYNPYGPDKKHPSRILSIPLNIMDATLRGYRGFTAEKAWGAAKDILLMTKDIGGCIGILWHNSYFDELCHPGYGKVYENILEWIAENNGWAVSCKEMQEYWTNRQSCQDWTNIINKDSYLLTTPGNGKSKRLKVSNVQDSQDPSIDTIIKDGNEYGNGQIKEAISRLETAIELGCEDAVVYNNLGVMCYRQQTWKEAESYLLKAADLDHKNKSPLVNLCKLYKRTNRIIDFEATSTRLLLVEQEKQKADGLSNETGVIKQTNLASGNPSHKLQTSIQSDSRTNTFTPVKVSQEQKIHMGFLAKPGSDYFLDDIIKFFADSYEVKKFIIKSKEQIVEALNYSDICWFEWCDDLIVYASQLEISQNKRIICRLHSYEAFATYIQQVNWKRVDHTIFVAPHIRELVLRNAKALNPESTSIVPNAVDLNKFMFKQREQGYNLAYVGHINYKKGPMLLLHAFRELVQRDSQYRLFIAGDFQDARYQLYFDQMIKEMGLEDNIQFYGWVKDINSWLEDKQYIVCTSVLEGHPVGIMEAMSRGLKPLIHNFVGARGIYPDRYIWNTIPEFIDMATEDNYDSMEYRKFIETNYSLEKQLDSMDRIIQRTCKESIADPQSAKTNLVTSGVSS